MKRTRLILTGLVALCSVAALANAKNEQLMRYETRFGEDEWNHDDWIFVKSPRWDYIGDWVQETDHIRNRTPAGLGENQLIADRYSYAYMSMVRREPVNTTHETEITARMSFSHDQGPQIVLADRLGANDDGYPEYRDHYEVVLFSKGINVWRHIYREGRPGWARVAYARFPLEAGTIYEMKVRIEPVARSRNGPADAGRVVVVTVDDKHDFAFHAPEMPDKVYAGITGYASFNRFYHFAITGKGR